MAELVSKKKVLEIFSLARTASFALQSGLLPFVEAAASGKRKTSGQDFSKNLKMALPKIWSLLKEDSQNIDQGFYPSSVLYPENPITHILRIPKLLLDAYAASKRRQKNISQEFDKSVIDLLVELPDYYKRNFHFQTSGYLGEDSAELYDHQVEVLFAGAADPMRRMIIPQLKKVFDNSDGEKLHFLEIGSGTGRLTRFIALAFPKAKITCVDLSAIYLKKAQSQLKEFRNINFIQGNGEELNFKEGLFDCVFSCFMFHELPLKNRQNMVSEGHRLLKKHGVFGIVDSIQLGDDPDMNWALLDFPKNFHEPFFKNYVSNPLHNLFDEKLFSNIEFKNGFLSKSLIAKRK